MTVKKVAIYLEHLLFENAGFVLLEKNHWSLKSIVHSDFMNLFEGILLVFIL